MTDTKMNAAQLVAAAKSEHKYMGDNIPVSCPCGEFRDVVSHQQYADAKRAVMISLCPNCKGVKK